ncbi:Spo0B C-terminal domain-containing protein, partial [Bacillus pumilus]|uniref:Spo0B C-terminal domain-containing protein n=1 Tax=Bacillus pumilus TaxID=1408 RepID=UPI003703C5F4
FNSHSHFITLQYQLLPQTPHLSPYQSHLLTLSHDFFSIFHQSLSQKTQNHLTLTFQTHHQHNHLLLYFHFKPKLTTFHPLNTFHHPNYPSITLLQFHLTTHHSMIHLSLTQQ